MTKVYSNNPINYNSKSYAKGVLPQRSRGSVWTQNIGVVKVYVFIFYERANDDFHILTLSNLGGTFMEIKLLISRK